ncbi:MAG: hypothetical protein EON51_02040 [Acinetobacter sp.]|nr:MAG: hypothetical protein EON51_02040 [Acinetobacter sp.]
MKKIEKKLTLNKKTIAHLDDDALANVKGGFTYSLSTGYVCMISQALRLERADCQAATPSLTVPRFWASEEEAVPDEQVD